MKTLVVANQKGGIGKSTTAQAIGTGLALAGKSVLFVDLDPQGNSTQTMGLRGAPIGAAEVLLREESIENAVKPSPEFHSYMLPSTPNLNAFDLRLTETGKEFRLREALDEVADRFDFCVIDTPPALGILTVNAFTSADILIVPVQADAYSLEGVGQLSNTVKSVRQYCNPKLKFDGFVLTRFNPRTIISRDLLEVFEKTAHSLGTRVYKSAIPECTAVKEAQLLKKNVFEYAPDSTASVAYRNLVAEILGE